MMLDALLQLSSAQAVTATAVSTNVIDLSQPRDIGVGEDLYATFGVDTSATAAGAATVTFEVIVSANSDLSSPTVIAATGAIPKAELTAGRAPISLPIPPTAIPSAPLGQRYLGVRYTVGTGPLTAGAFTATITKSAAHGQKYYPTAYTVY
ncbi:MAG: hypothetical protein MK041_03400 [Aquabacterium sp.]|nr:hypothetical protein [Aquabacterium sp.]